MSEAGAEVYITKLVAAKRQLRAAIRFFFCREDELAVHTVGAAAYNLLRELKATRRGDETEDRLKTLFLGLMSLAQALQAGKLPDWAAKDTHLLEVLRSISEKILPTERLDISSINVTIGESTRKSFWKDNNRVANFLKHANKDADLFISTSDIDNLSLLVAAANSYESVAPDDLGFEGLVLTLYFLASLDSEIDDTYPFSEQVCKLREMSRDERMAFCDYQLRRPRPASIEWPPPGGA